MIKYMDQKVFLDKALSGMYVQLMTPEKQGSGYFVKGIVGKRNYFARIGDNNEDKLRAILDEQRRIENDRK
jgi:hypothetical protein